VKSVVILSGWEESTESPVRPGAAPVGADAIHRLFHLALLVEGDPASAPTDLLPRCGAALMF